MLASQSINGEQSTPRNVRITDTQPRRVCFDAEHPNEKPPLLSRSNAFDGLKFGYPRGHAPLEALGRNTRRKDCAIQPELIQS